MSALTSLSVPALTVGFVSSKKAEDASSVAVTVVPVFGVGDASSANAMENGIVPSSSPPLKVYVAVQLFPTFETAAAFPSIETVGVVIVSLEVNVRVAVSPTFAHSGAAVSISLSDFIVTAERTGATPSTAVTVVGVTASFPGRSRKLSMLVKVTDGSAPVPSAEYVMVMTPDDDSVAADIVAP